MLCRRLLQRLAPVEHGRRIKPRPDALLRTALQPDAALPVHGDQQPPGLGTALELARSHGIIFGIAKARRAALRLQRTDQAAGLARRADGGTQVHQALGIAGHGLLQILGGAQLLGQVPQFALIPENYPVRTRKLKRSSEAWWLLIA